MSEIDLTDERAAMAQVCSDIQEIMRVYREQMESLGGLDTPGGLEHMGDVWSMFYHWDKLLSEARP